MSNDYLARLYQELAAAPTRKEAADIFEARDWVFLRMNPAERESAYARIEDIINEKPE